MDSAALVPFVHELTAASGDLIRRVYADPAFAVVAKSDGTPVTEADRGAEALLRRMIRARFPDHGVIGEEFGNEREDAEWVWVLDPIDGTKSFVAGVPLFGTLIGLLHRGEPVLGVIHQPVLGMLCIGDGRTTTVNGQPVRVRDTARLADAVVLASDTTTAACHQDGAAWERLLARVRLVRTWGDCFGYLLVATGRADVMTDPIMAPWDLLPLIPVIRGAGGAITDWHGGDPVRGTSIVASTPGLHAEVIATLAGRSDAHDVAAPSAWVARFADLVRPGGTVLDVAAGRGRHARFFSARGHHVVAVDRDPTHLASVDGLEVVQADLESGSPWPLGDRTFDAIVVTNYLHRPLLPILLDRLAPGGVLLYETFARGNERLGRPSNPDFLLERGELLRVAGDRLRVVAFEDVEVGPPRPAVVQRIAAVRDR